jgi:hypothetical protein
VFDIGPSALFPWNKRGLVMVCFIVLMWLDSIGSTLHSSRCARQRVGCHLAGLLSVPRKQGYPLLQHEDTVPTRLISSRVVNSTRPHHVDGSRAATWPEKTIYSKVSTVGPYPHGKVPDPCIYRPDLRARSMTSTGANRTPGTGPGPPCVGSGPLTAGSRDSETKNTQA